MRSWAWCNVCCCRDKAVCTGFVRACVNSEPLALTLGNVQLDVLIGVEQVTASRTLQLLQLVTQRTWGGNMKRTDRSGCSDSGVCRVNLHDMLKYLIAVVFAFTVLQLFLFNRFAQSHIIPQFFFVFAPDQCAQSWLWGRQDGQRWISS